MSNRVGWSVITILFIIILVLLYFLIVTPAPAPTSLVPTETTATTSVATTTDTTEPATTTLDENAPLHERVIVQSPRIGGSVLRQFEVTGEAPGNWYFEASFPVQVRDTQGNVLAQTYATAQSDWMTTVQVPFKANVSINYNYSGNATLILLRDNPSGLPQNDDALEVPITII